MFQDLLHHIDEHLFVIHNHDMLMAARQVLLVEDSGFRLNHHVHHRQVEMKLRKTARMAECLYGTAACLDDTVNDRKSHACAFSGLLGGEIGIENPIEDGVVDAMAGVGDHQPGVIAWRQPNGLCRGGVLQHDRFQPDGQDAAVGFHGMGGIGAQIEHDLVDLSGVGDGGAYIFADIALDEDVGGQRCAHQFERFGDDPVEVKRLAAAFFLAAETEQLLNHLPGPQTGGENPFQVVVGDVIVGYIRHGQFGVAQDDAQYIVEIVGDAASQGADGFHLLGLAQLIFQPAVFGFDALLILLHLPLFKHVLHTDDQFIRLEGFSQIIAGALANGLDGRIDRGLAGDNDEGGTALLPVYGVKHFKAGHSRHHDIQNDQIGAVGMDERQSMAGVVGRLNPVAVIAQHRFDAFGHQWFIVTDQQSGTVIHEMLLSRWFRFSSVLRSILACGQLDVKTGPPTGDTFAHQDAVDVSHRLIDNGQPQSVVTYFRRYIGFE